MKDIQRFSYAVGYAPKGMVARVAFKSNIAITQLQLSVG